MNVYLPYTAILPSEYQEVEYIQSTGTQYINTSIIPSDTKGIYMKMSSQDVTNDLVYFGSNVTAGGKIFGMGNVSSKIYYGWNGWLAAASRPSISADTIVELENNYMNSRKYKKDGVDVASISATMSSSGYGITIFGYNVSGSIQYPCKIKLYSCKISDGSSIVNNFIPCYRKSDSVIGLYDLVNSVFYTNSGTGTFSKGNDVTMTELKNAYIGEVYEYSYDFRNKSTAQIQADGFSVGEGSVKLNANGLASNSSSARIIVNKSIPSLSNAKKITVIQNCILSSGSVAVRLNGSGRTYATGIYMDDGQNWQLLSIANTNYTYSGVSAGTYTQKAVFDLVNKTATLSCTGKTDHTETITDTEISNIKNNVNNTEIYVYGSSSYVQSYTIIIEY